MAQQLDIPIFFKLNFLPSYKPKDPEKLKRETGLSEVTREEYLDKYKVPYLSDVCFQAFNDPQFNWDGMLLGCCRNEYAYFTSKLFKDGLEACLQDEGLQKMKKILRTKNPTKKDMEGLPCRSCSMISA